MRTVVLLAGAVLLLCGGLCCAPDTAPLPPVMPAPPAPPAPAPEPCPPDKPCPKPRPRPCPHLPLSPVGGPLGATVGGPVGPGGVAVQLDLHPSQWQKNTVGSDGSGLCVFASLRHSGRWHNEPVMAGLFEYMKGQPGGGYPSKVTTKIREYAHKIGRPEPAYLQVESADLGILVEACSAGLMPGITYSFSPTGRYGGAKIAHMVSLVHADGTHFAVLDNNCVSDGNQLEWMTRDELARSYAHGGSGWAVIPLACPPPPPRNSREEQPPVLIEQALPDAAPRQQTSYRWEPFRDGDVRQVKLVTLAGDQVGTWVFAEGAYYPLLRGGHGPACAPPIEPPPGCFRGQRDFGMQWSPGQDGPSYRLGDRPVSRDAALELVRRHAAPAVDDRLPKPCHLWLTVIGAEADRKRVVEDLAGHQALSGWKGRLCVNAYDPAAWQLACGFVHDGRSVTICLQQPDGTELLHLTSYDGPEALAEGLRRADPDYRPRPDGPDAAPQGPGGGIERWLSRFAPGVPVQLLVVIGGAVLLVLVSHTIASRRKP